MSKINSRKVAIVGCGFVGSASAFALMESGLFSEMVLIEAEAQYRLGNEGAARDLLVELNATSGRDPEYTCTATGSDLMEQIKLYRGIELWGEGFNWFDLKRWGDTISRKTYANGGNWMSQYAITIGPNEKNNWTWCIPQHETNYNKGITSTAN